MKAEIISVGSELTSGQNLDTNSQWLSRELAKIGIAVGYHTTLSDDLADNVAAMRIANERAGLVVITGGIGPTLDDLTRDALAQVAGVSLVFHEPSFAAIKDMFARRSREMPERNRLQALFPAGAEPIPNDHGTAPGIWMRVRDTWIAALPGVPREMTEMYRSFVRTRLLQLGLSEGVIVERKINTFGAGESQVEAMLGDLTERGRQPEVGITASNATISLRITARASDEPAARAAIAPVEADIRKRLGHLVFGTNEEELPEVVGKLLKEKRMTVATAESITAGQVASLIARVPGASEYLVGGIVAYSNEIKASLLGVPKSLISQQGAVSAAVAEAMAFGCRQVLGCDLAISTTGIAGPGNGGEDKPVGSAFIGLAWHGGVLSRSVQWFGSRLEVQRRTAKSALNLLRLFLHDSLTHEMNNT